MSRFDTSKPIPILLLSDGPDQGTGLARIAHDLAWILCGMPEFQVGVLGRMAMGRAHYPWVTYSFPATAQWGESQIQDCFEDLAQGRRGIIFSLWDASRLFWLADPSGMPDRLQNWLSSGAVERWSYCMHDSEGVIAGKIPLTAAHVFSKFDRVMLASKWAYGITRNTLPNHPDLDWLPHPVNINTFSPMDRAIGRSMVGVNEREILLSCVMANQDRKHFPTVLEALALMRSTTAGKPKMWIKTDKLMPIPGWGHFNIQALVHEYGLNDRVFLDERKLSDKEMAMLYSACDASVLISGAEGFAYTIPESLSCGVPCVSGKYSASGDLASHAVPPCAFQIQTQYNVKRALYDSSAVAFALETATDQVRSGDWEIEWSREQTAHLAGNKIGKLFQRWFRKGLQ